MITYSEAAAKVARSRSGEPKLMANTYIHRVADGYAVRYHCTDIITIHDDGTYSLNTAGWNTATTLRRINDYGPARVSSDHGTLVVWSRNDPRTPVKMSKCRVCHGTGETHSTAYWQRQGTLPHNTYEVKTDFVWNTARDGATYAGWSQSPDRRLTRDGQDLTSQPRDIQLVGQVVRHDRGSQGTLPVPVFHPSEASVCYRCHGDRVVDYGSKPRPVIFHDGITVDSYGEVTDPDAERMYPTPEEIAGREAARARQARLYERRNRERLHRERVAWLAGYGLTESRGRVVVFKAVGDDLRSVNSAPGESRGFLYPIGETVTAPDYRATPACGGGLHFGPTPYVAQSYYQSATRYLACSVLVRGMQVIGDKCKVQSAKVLYEVDMEGDPI